MSECACVCKGCSLSGYCADEGFNEPETVDALVEGRPSVSVVGGDMKYQLYLDFEGEND